MRGVLSDQDPVSPPQPVAGRTRLLLAIWWTAAARWTWWWWRAPIRMPPTRTSTTPIRTGSQSMPKARSGRIRTMPDMWVTCALGPYNFEFMTEVTQEIVAAVQGRWHLQQSLGRQRHVLLRALQEPTFADVCGIGPAAHATIRRIPPAAITSCGSSSGCLSCGICGTRRSARSTPTPASSRTPAAAPLATWT